ncbi:hypothetical protein BDN71DRAFT_1444677 [Pleurotus eryngii]|uniref:Uncharacterized protein n=1 Tax=Pleurotus eryngii TaxID=5323 RepID=A0A9P6A1F3_PLEER|nr:hypothetical protein BDN71DRAFT_1444677 [Pleurotus eryngii]
MSSVSSLSTPLAVLINFAGACAGTGMYSCSIKVRKCCGSTLLPIWRLQSLGLLLTASLKGLPVTAS